MTWRPVECGVEQRMTYMDPRGCSEDGNEMGGGKTASLLFHHATSPTHRPHGSGLHLHLLQEREGAAARCWNHSCTSKEGGKALATAQADRGENGTHALDVAVLPAPLPWANDVQRDTGRPVCGCEGVGGFDCLGICRTILQIQGSGVTSSTATVAKQPLLASFESQSQL
jgi:hypothetical protein